MEYNKVYPRSWSFNCAQSGNHPDWSFNNARDLVLIIQSFGVEPWSVFPGTRQVMVETYDDVTAYQLSLIADSIERSKLGKKIDRVWSSGSTTIYINYVGRVDPEKAASMPDFNVGDVLKDMVSDELIMITEVGDNYYGIKYSSGFTSRSEKSLIKCGYKITNRKTLR